MILPLLKASTLLALTAKAGGGIPDLMWHVSQQYLSPQPHILSFVFSFDLLLFNISMHSVARKMAAFSFSNKIIIVTLCMKLTEVVVSNKLVAEFC